VTEIRIKELRTDRVRAKFAVPDVKASDSYALLLILGREVKARNLGKPEQFRIEAWDQRRGWLEHRP
jgi:hypothetical protein